MDYPNYLDGANNYQNSTINPNQYKIDFHPADGSWRENYRYKEPVDIDKKWVGEYNPEGK